MARANQDSQRGSLSGNNPGGGLDLTLRIGLPNNGNPDGRVDTELRNGQPHEAFVNFNENPNRGDTEYITSAHAANYYSRSPEIGNPSGSRARSCMKCRTTNTPEWRKGDLGKDLCNACGLREKRKEKKIWPGH